MAKKKKKIDCKPNTCRERLAPPGRFDRRSFRMKAVPGRKGTYIVVACPKRKYRRGRCTVGLRAQSIVRPSSAAKCRVCAR